MDLFCPHCSQRVTIPDDKSGQVMGCPLCSKQFMTPALAPPPNVPAPPPVSTPAPETYGMGPTPSPPPVTMAPAPTSPASIQLPASPPPPSPPGEYTRSHTCELTGAWLVFVPTACVLAIFVLSFFNWHLAIPAPTEKNWAETAPAASLWGLLGGSLLGYFLFTLLAGVLCLAAVLIEKNIIPTPPQVAPFVAFKDLAAGVVLGLAFLMLCFDYLDGNLTAKVNPIALAEKLAFRLHLFATLASFAMFWLAWRKKRNLPPPKCEARW